MQLLFAAILKLGFVTLFGAAVFSLSESARAQENGAAPGEDGAAAEDEEHAMQVPRLDWSFAGPLGRYDPTQLRRGLEVYRSVCQGCHGLTLVPFRMLADPDGPGLSDEEMRAVAASYQITDGPDNAGEMFERPGRPSDNFPSPYPNDQAAAVANNGAPPPDLSLMGKARGVTEPFPAYFLDWFRLYQEAGPNYVANLLTCYQDPPPGVEIPSTAYYNPCFVAGPAIAMPPPLFDGAVTYADGAPETADQYARDVAAFLMWTAEPHLVERKRLGLQVMIFLAVFLGLLYFSKRRLWAHVRH